MEQTCFLEQSPDAATNPGSSGSAIIDRAGRVVGVAIHVGTTEIYSGRPVEGNNLAVTVQELKAWLAVCCP